MGLTDGWDGSDYGALITALVGAYGATRNKSFHIAPESPETAAIRQRILGFVDNSPTRNMLGQMLGDYMKSDQNSPYQPPPPTYGYNPFPKGDSTPTFDLSKLLPMLQGGSTASPQPTTPQPGGLGTGGSPATQPGGQSGIPNAPPDMPANLSAADQSTFMDFVRQYGKAAAESLIAIVTANPMLGVKGAIDLYRSYTGGRTTYDPGFNSGLGPTNVAAGGEATPTNAGDNPYNNPFMQKPQIPWGNYGATVPTPPNNTPFNPQYAGNQGPGYYDPMGGASAISGLLGMQMGDDSDGKGPKKF